MNTAEILSELPKLTEAERRSVRGKLCDQAALERAMMFDRMRTKMTAIKSGEVWQVDFGLAAKVRPALLLTGNPADDELDLVTVLLHTTSLRGNRWELSIPKPFLKPGTFHLQQIKSIQTGRLGTSEGRSYRREVNLVWMRRRVG